jgi:hypothetical protein
MARWPGPSRSNRYLPRGRLTKYWHRRERLWTCCTLSRTALAGICGRIRSRKCSPQGIRSCCRNCQATAAATAEAIAPATASGWGCLTCAERAACSTAALKSSEKGRAKRSDTHAPTIAKRSLTTMETSSGDRGCPHFLIAVGGNAQRIKPLSQRPCAAFRKRTALWVLGRTSVRLAHESRMCFRNAKRVGFGLH